MAGQEQPSTFAIDSSEAWRQVSPEEKIEMMNRSHAVGVSTAFVSFVILCTLAVAFQTVAIMWSGLIISPLIFQYAAGKAWRDIKPRVMLEYLAARSAARRFAFAEGAKDLHLQLMFRGNASPMADRGDIEKALEVALQSTHQAETWIALFQDTVVMIHEHPGGASLAFGREINERLKIESSDNGGYSNEKHLIFSAKDKFGEEQKIKVTSRYPGALAVFEKRTLQLQNEIRKNKEQEDAAPVPEIAEIESSNSDFSSF